MRRDAPDIDALLRPLAFHGAPQGFAARLSERYVRGMAARRRRAALIMAAVSWFALAGLVVSLASFLPRPSFHALLSVVTITAGLLSHVSLRPYLYAGTTAATGLLLMAVLLAACCVAMSAIVRRESFRLTHVQ